MINNLSLSNQQCWQHLSIDLAPYTVIVGPSGWGKSSIIRAFDAFVNCSAGTSRIRRGGKASIISLGVDGHIFAWHKGEKVNTYYYDDYEMAKAGRTCPSEILEILNLPTLKDQEGEELNLWLHKQFDSPSFIFDTPVSMARYFSSAIGAHFLSSALRSANSDRKATAQAVNSKSLQLTHLINSKTYLGVMRIHEIYTPHIEAICDYAAALSRLEQLQALQLEGDYLRPTSDPIEMDTSELSFAVFNLNVYTSISRNAVAEIFPPIEDYMPLQADLNRAVEDLCFLNKLFVESLLLSQVDIRIHDEILEIHELARQLKGLECPFCGAPMELTHMIEEAIR